MAVSYCDDAATGNEKLGSLATSSVHGTLEARVAMPRLTGWHIMSGRKTMTVYCVVIPQDRVDLVDVLTGPGAGLTVEGKSL